MYIQPLVEWYYQKNKLERPLTELSDFVFSKLDNPTANAAYMHFLLD